MREFSTQTDLPQLLPLQGELSLTPALSPRERENEKTLGKIADILTVHLAPVL